MWAETGHLRKKEKEG